MAYRIHKGLEHSDQRGSVRFFNSLDMTEIVRIYEISPISTDHIRAWQGHAFEKKWFYCSAGSFVVNLIAIDNFEHPKEDLEPIVMYLEGSKPRFLEITGGYVTGIKATEKGSKLTVFSDYSLEASKNDDYRFPIDKWVFKA